MKKGLIRIWASGNGWLAEMVDDQDVLELFGTSMIPTAYTLEMPLEEVISRVQALNPDCRVI